VLLEPGQEELAHFLADQSVRVVASMPCYSQANVDAQRGGGVFGRSIEGLRRLNAVGYGRPGSGLVLDLVYNPGGVFLAPPQAKLEPSYKQARSVLADLLGSGKQGGDYCGVWRKDGKGGGGGGAGWRGRC
jgi:hypothetical protein